MSEPELGVSESESELTSITLGEERRESGVFLRKNKRIRTLVSTCI